MAHNTGHTTQGTQHRAHSTQHRAHSTGHTAQGTQHTAQGTQHTAHNTGHTAHSTRHNTQHRTQHTTQGTQHRAHSTRHMVARRSPLPIYLFCIRRYLFPHFRNSRYFIHNIILYYIKHIYKGLNVYETCYSNSQNVTNLSTR